VQRGRATVRGAARHGKQAIVGGNIRPCRYNTCVHGHGVNRPHSIEIWRIELDGPAAAREAMERVLSPDEHERMGRLVFDRHRRVFAVTRGALRVILAERLGMAAVDLRFEYGKPHVAGASGPHFSVSHSGDLTLIAICQRSPIGVDVERLRPVPEAVEIAERFFAPREQQQVRDAPPDERDRAFLTLWTRKEAALKALGWGLSDDRVQVDASAATRVVVSRDSHAPLMLATRSVNPAPEYLAAVAFPDLVELEDASAAIHDFHVRAASPPGPRSAPA
jgi:4'-phosphopantetheinyl transferase